MATAAASFSVRPTPDETLETSLGVRVKSIQ